MPEKVIPCSENITTTQKKLVEKVK